jgi:23S rRNA pseudouridine1911/1915/1917 synthase
VTNSDDDTDDTDEQVHRVVVAGEQVGKRLDAVLAEAVPELSRAAVQRLIDAGLVAIERSGSTVATKGGQRVRDGEVLVVRVPAPEPLDVQPEPIPLAVLYEDADLIAIDKPAGLVVHPAPGHASGTLVNALLHHCTDLSGIGGVLRPGIVHRLDKDTSGVMVATKSDRAHAALTAAFAAKSRGEQGAMRREYLAIASPAPAVASGTLRTLYGRHPVDRKRFTSRVTSGKPAVTHWTVERTLHEAALVRLVLETGRTHQIRVHASEHGWPLVGDPVYGRRSRDPRVADAATRLARQALHAERLVLDHPVTGNRLELVAPLPADFTRVLDALALP